MILILPIIGLLFTPLLVVILQRWRPKSGLTWLVSAIIALLSWLVVLLSRLQVPERISFGFGQASFSFPFTLAFVLDKISWPFALALMASLVAFMLTSVTQLSDSGRIPQNWPVWPAALFFAGLSLFALVSGNLYTLLLAWAAIDLGWLLLKLVGDSPRQDIQFGFALRVFGLFWAIAAAFSQPGGVLQTFPIINLQTNTLLFIAAMIRLIGIIPASSPLPGKYPWQGLNIYLDLVLFSTASIIFVRTASTGISAQISPFILAATAITGLVCSFIWIFTSSNPGSWQTLLVGFTTFSIAGSILSGFEASLAWSIALMLAGSLVFFCNYTTWLIKGLIALGLVGIIGLPFTPAWQGIRIFPLPGQAFDQGAWWILFLVAQSLFLGGYLRAWFITRQPFSESERWSGIVYPAGLFLLPITQVIILIWGLPGLSNDLQAFPALILTWAPLASLGLTLIILWTLKRTAKIEPRFLEIFRKVSVLEWLYRVGKTMHLFGSQVVKIIDQILEGEAGILWTILFLLLLFALLISLNIRG